MNYQNYFIHSLLSQTLVAALGMCLLPPLLAETIKVSGHGEVPVLTVKRQKDQAAINQKALGDAEEVARKKAIRQAILQVFSNQDVLQSKLDVVLQTAMDNSATLILDKQVENAGIRDNSAQVDLIVQVDGKALRTLLENNFSISSTAETEGKFKIYVLSYTLEGMDANRAQPQVLHEDVVDNQKGVHSSNYAESASAADSHTASASLTAGTSSANRGQASAITSANGQYKSNVSGYSRSNWNGNRDSSSGRASQSGNMATSASGSANWDVTHSASVNGREHRSNSSSSKFANSGSAYDDTSHYYHRVVDYADPTQKGAALSNEVRAEIEGMMTTVGFDVATLNVTMMNRDFPTEDDLVSAVLNEMRENPTVSPNDYVAIALNSFTPVSVATHQFTSKVTYRIVRIKDGLALLPAKDITGDSGEQVPSDDVARSYAVKSAMLKVDDILPGEIRQALQKMHRAEKREAATAATSYVIVVDNATVLSTSAPIRSALTAAGFKVERNINGTAKVHTLTVTLNGKTGDDVLNTIEGTMGSFEIETMDNQSARVKAK